MPITARVAAKSRSASTAPPANNVRRVVDYRRRQKKGGIGVVILAVIACVAVLLQFAIFLIPGRMAAASVQINVQSSSKISKADTTDLVGHSIEVAQRSSVAHRPNPEHSRRFPDYGTSRYARECGWAVNDRFAALPSCTFFARPYPDNNEGLSFWASVIAANFMLARQAGCSLTFDYGKSVSMHEVLESPSGTGGWDWAVPLDFECIVERNCFRLPPARSSYKQGRVGVQFVPESGRKGLFDVPWYRQAYKNQSNNFVHQDQFKRLEGVFPGFRVETGMACALGALFQLSSRLSAYQPDLYTRIVPELRNEKNFVIAVYVRTRQSDGSDRSIEQLIAAAEKTAKCVESLEQQHLPGNLNVSRVLWLVVSDSPETKKWIAATYDSRDVCLQPTFCLPRNVIITAAKGKHSKPNIDPSTSDFAEGFMDWFLMGESDLVVAGGVPGFFTFGETAAMRTARPFYSSFTSCEQQLKMVH